MNIEKAIDALNSLIEINNDRIEGYGKALRETKESDLRNLFLQLQQTSRQCISELVNEVHNLGGIPLYGTVFPGKFFRVWMEVKATFSNNDNNIILNSLGNWLSGFAIDTYNDVLKNHHDDITAEQQRMLNAQHSLIRADYDKVMRLNHRQSTGS